MPRIILMIPCCCHLHNDAFVADSDKLKECITSFKLKIRSLYSSKLVAIFVMKFTFLYILL